MELVLHDEKDDKLEIKDWQYVSRELLSGIPSSTYKKKTDSWEFSKTWQTALALQNTFTNNLTISAEVMEWMTKLYNDTIIPAYNLRDSLSQEEGFEFLFPHQKVDAEFLANSKRVLLANDQGTGKSQGSFAGIRLLHERGEKVFPVLVACPNSTKFGWVDEVKKVWYNNPPEDMPELNIVVIDGTPAKKRKAFESVMESPDNSVIIINWESLRSHSRLKPFGSTTLKKCSECAKIETSVKPASCETHIKELNKINFGSVIGDECFTAGTLIDTPNGKVPIESLKIGDTIYGYDHSTSRVVETKVTNTLRKQSPSIIPGFNATPNHPYYVVGQGYRKLGDLQDDDTLLSLDEDGEVKEVKFSEYKENLRSLGVL